MKEAMVRVMMALSLPLVLVGGAIAAEKIPESTHASPDAMCAEMMQQVSLEGQKAMSGFIQSERAPQTMANKRRRFGPLR